MYSATPASVREINRTIVLNLIRLTNPISRIDLARQSGIGRSNISGIVDELIENGLVREVRGRSSGPGRVPYHLFLNDDSFAVLAVSVRPLRTTIATSGLTGRLLNTVSFPTPVEPESMVKTITSACLRLRSDHQNGAMFREIGISVPGLVNFDTGDLLWLPALPQYSGFGLGTEVRAATGISTAVDNDCNIGALAELWLAEQRREPLSDFLFIEIGDFGVGGGIVLNRSVYRGSDATYAAEFGHMSIDANGPKCNCGRRGCWQLYVSNRATFQRYRPRAKFEPAAFEGLLQALRREESRALDTMFTTADYLSLGISSLAFGLNPSRIFLAGAITSAWDLISDRIASAHSSVRAPVRITPASCDEDSLFLQGAVSLALRDAFANPRLGV